MTKFLSLLFISVAATRGPPKAPKPTKSTKADKPADNRLDDCKRYFGTIEAEEGGKEIKTLLIPNPDSLNSYLRCKRDISIQPPEYKVTPVGIEQSTPGGDEWIAGCWWMPGCGSGCGAFCQQDHENKKNCLKDIGCSNKQHCRINRSSPCAEVIEPITTEEPEEVTTKKEEVIEPITTEEPEEVTTKKEEGNCNSCDKFNDWKPLKDCKRWTSGLDECTGQNSRSWNRYCEKSCCKLKNCGKKETVTEPEETRGNCNSCNKFNDWKPLQDCKKWTSGLDECTGKNSRSWNRYCEKSCCELKNCGKKD